MESMNRTMVPEVTGTVSTDPSMRRSLQQLLKQWSVSSWQRATAWRRNRETRPARGGGMAAQSQGNPWYIAAFVLVVFLLSWHFFTLRSSFDQRGLSDEQLQMMEFNGDIVRAADGSYTWNPEKEKVKGIPGPLAVLEKAREELSEAFVKKGTNDHGIAYLVLYTVSRFASGFLAASVIAIMLGVILGLNKVLFRAANPFIQIMKPISPLAWMPLLLYTVKDPKWTAVLVVFMAAVWPTLATTAFGVSS